jgi:putative sterol carrier protein
METRTPREFFDNILPARFKPEKAVGIDVVAQVSIIGPNGGDWVVIIKDQKLEVKEGVHQSPKLTVTMKEKDYLDVINGKISGERAFFSGKLQVKGDIILALRLKDAGFL